MRTRLTALVAGLGALLLLAGLAALSKGAATADPQPSANTAAPRQDLLVPIPGQRLLMHTTVLRPPGRGPFPLAVINHGSTESSFERAQTPPPEYPLVSQWLLARGYLVALPVRPGHGATGGPYFEDQGRCERPDYLQSGLRTAASIQAAIDFLIARPDVDKSGVVVLGQSAGGWGALALASRNPPMVRAIVNFAGGRGGHASGQPNNNCSPDRLVEAAGEFGQGARIPTLWLYAENDSYFAPALSNYMYATFSRGGDHSEYHLLPPLGPEGHFLADSPAAFALWAPIVANFLAAHP